jgi:hypothetical protein
LVADWAGTGSLLSSGFIVTPVSLSGLETTGLEPIAVPLHDGGRLDDDKGSVPTMPEAA